MRSVENSPSRQRSSPQAKNQWRDDFLAGGQCGIQVRDPDQRDDFVQDLKTKRSRDQKILRPRDLETKIGDQTMMHRLTREENQPAVRRPAFSTAEAIAMSATSSRRRSEGWGLVLRIPHDTEPDVVVKEDGRVDAATRRAAAAGVGVAAPAAAAQQTVRASRGSCGVCKWARGVVSTAIPILAPLPNIA